MALNKTSMANKIIAKITAANPNMTGVDAAIVLPWLEAFCDGIIEEFNENGSIVMDAADFQILPGTFKDSQNQPIVGLGDNNAFDLTGKII